MIFMEDLGKETSFVLHTHRDRAQNAETSRGNRCWIVFPAFQPHKGRPQSTAKVGVIRVPT